MVLAQVLYDQEMVFAFQMSSEYTFRQGENVYMAKRFVQ